MVIQELYKPVLMAANSTYRPPYGTLGVAGFLCAVSGTISVTNERGALIVDAVPVTAGVYTPMPFNIDIGDLGSVVLAGGARGTLAIV